MKTLVIGDIHGCYAELRALLDLARLAPGDQIIAIGDLFDRGPEPLDVLRFFQETPDALAIMGNHERKHVRSFDGEITPAASQLITRHLLGESVYPQAVAWMSDLPIYLDLPQVLLVHAFYEPGIPLHHQREQVLVGTLSGEKYLQDRGFWPWYLTYDNPKPIIVGHRDYTDHMQPFIYQQRVYGIDTRCVYGGSLTGLLLPEFRLISVPARADHWTLLQRRFAHLHL